MRSIIYKGHRDMKIPIFLMFFASLFVFSGCESHSEEALLYEENYEITGSEKEELVGEISETIYDSIDRSNANAKEVIIDAIYNEGEDLSLPEGRYHITGQLTGNVSIRDREGKELFHALLAPPPLGVDSVTVDVSNTHVVHVDGFEEVHITPAPTQLATELNTGIWEVGKDIEEGQYVVTGNELGYLQVFEKGKSPQVYEVIGGNGATKMNVQLKNGQKLVITDLLNIKFESK